MMNAFDYWRLCDHLSVVQAALLIVGVDPSDCQDSIDNQIPRNRPVGYDAAKTALVNAIKGGCLSASVVNAMDRDGMEYGPDWHETRVNVEDLQIWLRARGISSGFFFPSSDAGPDYLSRSHLNYAPKLAAAIEAWKAVTLNGELRRGKSVKQALIIWLRQHANDFGLTKDDGNPNELGIEEVAKIANWDMRGGAPKTPGD